MDKEIRVVCYNWDTARGLFYRFIYILGDAHIRYRSIHRGAGLQVELDRCVQVEINKSLHEFNTIKFMSEQYFTNIGHIGFHGRVLDEYEFERDLDKFIVQLKKEEESMNTFVKIFSDAGCKGPKGLEDKANAYAEENNLEIVSACPCFRKGFLEPDGMFISVVFRKKDC